MKPALFCAALTWLLVPAAAGAVSPVVFSRQVLPVLQRECAGCHSGPAAPAGFSMESAERLFKGGRHGPAVIPGRPGESMILRYLTGQQQPQMPPGRPLAMDTIGLVRRWIAEGAKVDSFRLAEKAPAGPGLSPAPSASVLPAPVTALAVSPAGDVLAVGGFRRVWLLDPVTGRVRHTLPGPYDQVLCLAWSPDGKHLAAGGGLAGAFGEICVWDAPAGGEAWAPARIWKGHTDTIDGIAWRNGSSELASASLDRTVNLWDTAAGKVTRTIKDHVDAVFCVAYSGDGHWMATGSADRSVKLYRDGARVNSLPHADSVLALQFSPKGGVLATACADHKVRTWPLGSEPAMNPSREQGEDDTVDAIAYSGDGKTLVWGAANRRVKAWSGDLSSQRQDLAGCQDWVYAVAATTDGHRIFAGTADGCVVSWNGDEKKPSWLWTPGRAVVAHGIEAKK